MIGQVHSPTPSCRNEHKCQRIQSFESKQHVFEELFWMHPEHLLLITYTPSFEVVGIQLYLWITLDKHVSELVGLTILLLKPQYSLRFFILLDFERGPVFVSSLDPKCFYFFQYRFDRIQLTSKALLVEVVQFHEGKHLFRNATPIK